MAEITLINSPDNSNTNSNTHTSLSDSNERQVKKRSDICHPVWQYLSRDVNNKKNSKVKVNFCIAQIKN